MSLTQLSPPAQVPKLTILLIDATKPPFSAIGLNIMKKTAQTEDYQLSDYVSDVRQLMDVESNKQSNTHSITQAIKPLAKRLAASSEFNKDKYKVCDEEQGFGVHLLHEDENHELAMFLVSWLPGRGTKPHNHNTWAVVAIVEGEEYETHWTRKDDGTKQGYALIEQTGEVTLKAGDVVALLSDNIHCVTNLGKTVSMSLHTYGKHINYTGRSEFDPETNSENPMLVSVVEG